MEVIGKIQVLMPVNVNKFSKVDSDKFSIGIKVNDTFYNRVSPTEEFLNQFRDKLDVGYEIKIQVTANIIDSLEVISDKVEAKKGKEGKWEDDIVTFETLLTKAHQMKENFSIQTEMLQLDVEKKYALFKAVVIIRDKESNEIRRFEGHGDATDENVKGDFIKPHFIRMAETRAIVRALRWYTNNGCAEEEK